MGFSSGKSSAAPAPTAPPRVVSAGESEADSRLSLLERERKKKGWKSTLLSEARRSGDVMGAGGGNLKDTLG